MPKGAGYRRPDVAEEAGGFRLLFPWVFGVRTYLHGNWGWSGKDNGFFSENFLFTNRPLEFDSPTENTAKHCFTTSDLKLYRLYPKK